MTAGAILADLARRGIRVAAEGDRLRLRAPESILTDEVREAVAAHKPELLAALQSHTQSIDKSDRSPIPEPGDRLLSLVSMPGACPKCGGGSWWHAGGHRPVCATCHPERPIREPAPETPAAPPLPEPWRRRLRRAAIWEDLYAVIEDAEVAYAAGELPGPVVERLARLCNVLARRLPEVDRYGPRLWAEDLLPSGTEPDACPSCHRADWWRDGRSGRRICRVCHPPPGPEVEA